MREQRWFTDNPTDHSRRYVERFREHARRGDDLAGEARFVDALLTRGATVLDAGCGSGRLGADLHARGHTVVGIDVDETLVDAARADHPGPTWLVGDLTTTDFAAAPFDAAVFAGNVMVFMTPGTEAAALAKVAAQVRPGGMLVTGFATDRAYTVRDFDGDCELVGLTLEHRFATWDLRPWHADADWAVSVLRVPA